jgi:hypothetical protein
VNQLLIFRFSAFRHRFRLSAFSFQPSAFSLRRYFSSGWAFLIPYLAAYLLYYVMKWPVNPAGGGQMAEVSSQSSDVPILGSVVPPLLHVYWAVHAINLGLAAWALISLWREHRTAVSGQKSEAGSQRAEVGSQGSGVRSQKPGDGYPVSDLGIQFSEPAVSAEPSLDTPTAHGDFAGDQVPPSGFRFSAFQLSVIRDALQRLAPWLLLALLFYIPGVYLEFPADPWQHYARINEWSWLQTVGEHSYWAKSSYFLAYSLLGKIAPPTRQLFWLDFYYTGCCLLLCWQYYRLARAVGLGERALMLFVILQSVLFGNNIFGFYRYYGISSSIFAQLGAVALTRIAIEFASQKFQVPSTKGQGAKTKYQVPSIKYQGNRPELSQEVTEETEGIATGDSQLSRKTVKFLVHFRAFLWRRESVHSSSPLPQLPPVKRLGSLPSRFLFSAFQPFSFSAFASAALAALCLLAFIALNHPQGLGIAALGLAAVAIWRLIEWKRSMIWWLAAAALVLSVIAILWFPRDPLIAQHYRPHSWLTPWYGFNLFSGGPNGPGDRTRWIIGFFGMVNVLAAVVLLRRNMLIGWLTITPLLALILPFVAIPFSDALAPHLEAGEGIIAFPRMFLSIPPGLALIAFGAECHRRSRTATVITTLPVPRSHPESCEILKAASYSSAFCALWMIGLVALLVVPANGPFFNRLWNALAIPPSDLSMRHVIDASDQVDSNAFFCPADYKPRIVRHFNGPIGVLTTPGIGYALSATAKLWIPTASKRLLNPPAVTSSTILANLLHVPRASICAMPFWAHDELFTASSLAGAMSTHWLPIEVAAVHATQEELFKTRASDSVERRSPQLWLEWTDLKDGKHHSSNGAGVSVSSTFEDRGDLIPGDEDRSVRAGDCITLLPILRSPDGNGVHLSINVMCPAVFSRSSEMTFRPLPLGGDSWSFFKFEVLLAQPGEYVIELAGTTVWPTESYRVRYKMTVSPKIAPD